ncbi:MAG: ImmA/IrrE family metallo-endopeptidase [Fimbriimonadaceae bacterium]|nr:ImmA/IrrE family metallo-endopeptidase [Fimbriimonadaceae bacterium]
MSTSMATRVLATINGDVLTWSRQMAGLEPHELAKRAAVRLDDLLAFEAGRSRPTVPQLGRLAKACLRPSAVFFLPQPPPESPRVADLRQLPEGTPAAWSYELRRQIRYVERRQAWVRENAAESQPPLDWLGATTLNDDCQVVGQRLRERLGWSLDQQLRWHSPKAALPAWQAAVERLGVLVFQTGLRPELMVQVDEMRGVALADPVAPAIVINGSDAEAGRVFSLMHELAHLALGQRAVSGWQQTPLDRAAMDDRTQRLEVFCNRVAAHLLVPAHDCEEQFRRRGWPLPEELRDQHLDPLVTDLSRRYAVSRLVILRRLLDSGYLSRDLYQDRSERYREAARPAPRKPARGGPAPSVVALSRHGQRFTRLVTAAYEEGQISAADFADLLSTSLDQHDAIRGHLLQRAER